MCVIHQHRLIGEDGDTIADLEQPLDRLVDDDTPADRPLPPSAASASAACVHA